jgi:putative phage-type endonuclease
LPFELVEFEQGSREWLDWRRGGIGASDAPAIMGESRWRSADQVLKEKLSRGAASFESPAMARGTRLEPVARSHYNKRFNADVAPACLQSKRHAWMRASVDGISASGRLVEIKCGEGVYGHTARTGTVPGYYFGQLQHILCVTGFSAIDFWVFLPQRPPLHLAVPRDEVYIARLVEVESAFWARVTEAEPKLI